MVTHKAKLSIYLPGQLKEALAKLAAKDKRFVSTYLEVLILEALESRGIKIEIDEEGE
jgi:hypothetical protein